jgi:hypothetical protein
MGSGGGDEVVCVEGLKLKMKMVRVLWTLLSSGNLSGCVLRFGPIGMGGGRFARSEEERETSFVY